MTSSTGLLAAAAVETTPAGGAELMQVIGASAVGGVLTLILLALGLGHRTGRTQILAKAAGFAERTSGLPGWAALPVVVAGQALLVAVVGMYWDISLHIDNGRDPGPLANPSHYFILFGLFGLFAGGFLALVLPEGRPGRAAVSLTKTWQVPIGGIVLMACGAFALTGFPLDDVSHRLFGQDVTLWGPTHLMLIGGAGLSLFGMLMLLAEGRQALLETRRSAPREAKAPAAPSPLASRLLALAIKGRIIGACGGLLIGMSVYQGEFDFGVPQFRLLYQPVLIAVAAGVALTCARLVLGRGGALAAVAFFLVVRGALALLVGGALGQTTPHFPLFLVEGLVVEAVAIWLGTRKSIRFGAVAGAGVGTLGTLGAWGWSHVWMPIEWPANMMGEAFVLTLVTGTAAGVLGAFAGAALLRRPEGVTTPPARRAALAGVLAIVAAVAYLGPTNGGDGLRAAVTLTPVPGSDGQRVVGTVRFDDAEAVEDAQFLHSLAWQGRETLHLEPLKRVAPGLYETAAMPVGGTWKTMIRVQKGSLLAAMPVSLPEDAAIPAPAVPASASFERPFVADAEVLQRERDPDTPAALWAAAFGVVGLFFAALLALMGWAFMRVARTGEAGPSEPLSTPPSAPAPAAAPVPAGATA